MVLLQWRQHTLEKNIFTEVRKVTSVSWSSHDVLCYPWRRYYSMQTDLLSQLTVFNFTALCTLYSRDVNVIIMFAERTSWKLAFQCCTTLKKRVRYSQQLRQSAKNIHASKSEGIKDKDKGLGHKANYIPPDWFLFLSRRQLHVYMQKFITTIHSSCTALWYVCNVWPKTTWRILLHPCMKDGSYPYTPKASVLGGISVKLN